MIGKYKVIKICCSTKFKDECIKKENELTVRGNIVISFIRNDCVLTEESKETLMDMSKYAIDIADEVFVVNIRGYIDSDTQKEIEYAESIGKPIRYMIQHDILTDMKNIGQWSEVGQGIFRYYVYDKLYYEIIVLYKDPTKDLLDSIANLYVFGFTTKSGINNIYGYERACILLRGTVRECINKAFNLEEKFRVNGKEEYLKGGNISETDDTANIKI